jgi:hypothetical protein
MNAGRKSSAAALAEQVLQHLAWPQGAAAIQQVVGRRDHAIQVEQLLRFAPPLGGGQTRQVGGQVAVFGDEFPHALLAEPLEAAVLGLVEAGGERRPARRSRRHDGMPLARRAPVVPRREPRFPRRALFGAEPAQPREIPAVEVRQRRREAVGELRGEQQPALRRQLLGTIHEPVEHAVLILREPGVERRHHLRGVRGSELPAPGPGPCAAHPLANHDRPGGVVAQSLPRLGEEQAGDPHAVEDDGLHVHQADEIAHRRRGEGDGVSPVAHHTQVHQPLARGLAVGERLEQHVVAPQDAELHEHHDRDRPGVGIGGTGRGRGLPGRDVDQGPDEPHEQHERHDVVDDRGRRPRPDAGERVREHHQLGRLDVDGGGERCGGRSGAGGRHADLLRRSWYAGES